MSNSAKRWDGVSPVTEAANRLWQKNGFLFGGSPPMSNYYPREWLVAIAAVLRRPLEVKDLRSLFQVRKESESLGGRRHKRVLFFMFGDQHVALLAQEGIAETVRRRDDVLTSSVIVPVSKFNQAVLIEHLMKRSETRPYARRTRWPRKREAGTVPMGSSGPGGDRHTVKGILRNGGSICAPKKPRFPRTH